MEDPPAQHRAHIIRGTNSLQHVRIVGSSTGCRVQSLVLPPNPSMLRNGDEAPTATAAAPKTKKKKHKRCVSIFRFLPIFMRHSGSSIICSLCCCSFWAGGVAACNRISSWRQMFLLLFSFVRTFFVRSSDFRRSSQIADTGLTGAARRYFYYASSTIVNNGVRSRE